MGAINIDANILGRTSYVPPAEEEFTGADCDDTSSEWGTILLVEDEAYVREITREVLELCGYTVLTASNAAEGIQRFEQHGAPIHLLVTDVVMPGMNGRELAQRLMARSPQLKAIFMSGYTDNPVLRDAFHDPETVYIQKPFTLETLLQRVREVLTFGRTASCVIA